MDEYEIFERQEHARQLQMELSEETQGPWCGIRRVRKGCPGKYTVKAHLPKWPLEEEDEHDTT